MNPVRKGILVLVLGIVIGLAAGCAMNFKAPLIEPVLDALVPADYRGDFATGARGQYLNIDIVATDLHKNAQGRWTWKTLRYRRKLTVPIAPGVPYNQDTWVEMPPPARMQPSE